MSPMRRIMWFLIGVLLVTVVMVSMSDAGGGEYGDGLEAFRADYKQHLGAGEKPEIYIHATDYLLVLVELDSEKMRLFRYHVLSDTYNYKDIKRLEDSTKSPFHQTPSERLQEAIETYEGQTD